MNLRGALLLFSVLTAAPAGAAALRPDLASLATVPQHRLPAVVVDKAVDAAPRKDRPYDFAVAVEARLSLAQGQWRRLDDRTQQWRMRVHSPGARSLSLHLFPFEVPRGAEVWVYDGAGALVHGPYTAAHNHPEGLWTPIVAGDEIVVEARLRGAPAPVLRLGIERAYHGYRDWNAAEAPAKAGSCNIDVACSQGDAWRADIRSVARVQISGNAGSVLCTGQLVNNVRQDLTPYFLTADHCGIGDLNGGPAQSVVLYFNYERPQCGSGQGDLTQTLTGSRFLADNVESDFTLVEMMQSPPDLYGVYYAGWNVRGDGSSAGAGIHHPSGDEKSISLYDTALVATEVDIGSGRVVDSWRVRWDEGVTEPGSSGSGLWNSQHQLIGVLSGGSASCSNPTAPDYYGRLDMAWTAEAGSDGQLKAHLDPDGTGCLSLPGRDPAGPVAASEECSAAGGGGSPSRLLLIGLAAALVRRARASR